MISEMFSVGIFLLAIFSWNLRNVQIIPRFPCVEKGLLVQKLDVRCVYIFILILNQLVLLVRKVVLTLKVLG